MKVHLLGFDQGTACGQNASWGVPDTDDPEKVTCKRCRATEYFATLAKSPTHPHPERTAR